ncbi:hypothetical protein AC481_07255 [miscellaneous Crenarchaeota group archaeon SMTZ-80]|nr:MAG: hypothetical protein AC481_07255 [miscellaneous Crenarchaeota group archaeon SMTZ-80]
MVCLIFAVLQTTFSQTERITKNNFTGYWEDPVSWEPVWEIPQTDSIEFDITINGYISRNGSLNFSIESSILNINDTLIVYGDLMLGNKCLLNVNLNGILIVFGNLIAGNKEVIDVNSDAFLVVTGDYIKRGTGEFGSFNSDNTPSNVFFGGLIQAGLSPLLYPVFDCSGSASYDSSQCSYGNLSDLENYPVYSFFKSLCVNAVPTITSSDTLTFCEGGNVTLTSSAGTDYLWSTGETTPSINVTTTGSYTVKVSYGSGCQSAPSAATEVTINVLPEPIITINENSGIMNNDGIICEGESATLSASGGVSYAWSSGEATAEIIKDTAGIFTVTVTDANGCQNTKDTAITVNPMPTPAITITDNSGIANNDGIICEGESATLSATGGISYSWSSGEATAEITKNSAGIYTVTVTDINGCQNTKDTTITGFALPTPVITITDDSGIADNDGIICEGESATLSATGGIRYNWSSGETTAEITKNTAGTYTVIVNDVNGCRNKADKSIVITKKPEANAGIDNQVCGQDYTFNASLNSGTGTWTVISGPGNVNFSSDANNPSATIHISNYGNYKFRWTVSIENCTASSDVIISFHKIPVVNAGTDQELNYAFNTRMEAELSPSETGEWSLLSGSGIINDINSPVTTVSDLSAGENIFLWTVRSGICSASDSISINVNDLFVPQVITPNGDLKNDFFVIEDIEKNGPAELIIFDRWGNEVFTSFNYLNDWDGRRNNKTELSNDTYFYVLKLANGKITRGFVVIKR